MNRIAFAVVIIAATIVSAEAQPRTSPPTLDFTCHGYDEGPTRAYNCIPEPSQQHHMRTFVPPVGSLCDKGSIITTSDQPDRYVFQIRCQDEEGTTPPPSSADYDLVSIHRYEPFGGGADWLRFTWRVRHAGSYEVTVTFNQGSFTTICQEIIFNAVAGEQENETSIPSICGVDEQWSSVSIAPSPGRYHGTCGGCGTYARTSLPASRSLNLDSADPSEVPIIIEEASYRVQIGAVQTQQ